jgi:integrase
MQGISNDELLALLGAARAARERDWLFILVSYWHGLRVSEAVNLRLENLRGGVLTVQRLKHSLKTIQPLIEHPNPLLNEKAALTSYTLGMYTKQRLFPFSRVQGWRIVQKHGATAGLPAHKRFPHMLKHTIALATIGTAGIENTRQWLGHKSMGSTGEYLRVSDEQAAVAVARAGGGRV